MTGRVHKRHKHLPDHWQLVADWRDENGKRQLRYKSVRGSKRHAREVLRQWLNELEADALLRPTDDTVAGYLQSWVSEVAVHQVSARTLDRYVGIVDKHLVPRLGTVKLSALRPDQVQRCYSDMAKSGLPRRPPALRTRA